MVLPMNATNRAPRFEVDSELKSDRGIRVYRRWFITRPDGKRLENARGVTRTFSSVESALDVVRKLNAGAKVAS